MLHLIPVKMTTTATELLVIYVCEVVQLHGLPSLIVSDQDPKFMSKWWHDLQWVMGTKILMSTSFHPQTDGATEHANHSIAQILHAFISPNQKDWVKCLSIVEFAINSSINHSTGMAPFKINFGFMPRFMKELPVTNCMPPGVWVFAMNVLCNMVIAHNVIIAECIFQCHFTNKCWHEEAVIRQEELVYLSMRNLTFPKECASKLVPKFVGPYRVLSALPGTSNYELELPTELTKQRVHNHFHVNLLKPHVASNDALFPNRTYPNPYDFSAPDNAKWYVKEITAHC